MSVATTVRTYTVEDLAQLGDKVDFELDRGMLVPVMPPGWDHGSVSGEIQYRLDDHVRRQHLGQVVPDVGFVLERGPDTLRAPDVAFVRAERAPAMRGSGFPDGWPDLAVEVVGPDRSLHEAIRKAAQYLEAGCRLVWILHNLHRRVLEFRADGTVRTLSGEDVLDGGDVLPGFACKVSDIFKVLD